MTKLTKAELEVQLANKTAEFEDFKKFVVDKTMNYHAGCDSGKQDFLQELGLLKVRSVQIQFALCINVEDVPENISDDNLADEIQDNMADIMAYYGGWRATDTYVLCASDDDGYGEVDLILKKVSMETGAF